MRNNIFVAIWFSLNICICNTKPLYQKQIEARSKMPFGASIHFASSLPRIDVQDLALPENSAYLNLERPFILTNAMVDWNFPDWQLPESIVPLSELLGTFVVSKIDEGG